MVQKFEQLSTVNSNSSSSTGSNKRSAVRVVDDSEQPETVKSSCCWSAQLFATFFVYFAFH